MKRGIAVSTIPEFLPASDMEEYRRLIEEKKRLEDRVKALGAKITDKMREHDLDKVQLSYGSYSVVSVPRYEYTDAVTEFEEALKDQKKQERESGKAKASYTSSLRYTPVKK